MNEKGAVKKEQDYSVSFSAIVWVVTLRLAPNQRGGALRDNPNNAGEDRRLHYLTMEQCYKTDYSMGLQSVVSTTK